MDRDRVDQEREKERTRARRLEKLRFWRSACSAERPVVARYNSELGSTPLFFFHGDWDNGGLYMARLAADLQTPVLSLAPHLAQVPASIRAMAHDRLPEIFEAQPEGPYRIGGFCNGALVAYEAAQLLIEQGQSVEVVLLVAPPSLNARRSYRRILSLAELLLGPSGPDATSPRRGRVSAVMGVVTALRRLTSYSRHELSTVFARKRQLRASTRERLQSTGSRAPSDLAAEAGIQERRRALLAAYSQAINLYSPKPAPARLIVLGTGLDRAGLPGPGFDAAYDGRAWAELCSQSICIPVSGDHYTCIADHAVELARVMTSVLGVAAQSETDSSRDSARAEMVRGAVEKWPGRSGRSQGSVPGTDVAARAGTANGGLDDVA